MRLQALVRGHNVRKQAQMTMRCMQALVRVQARVRARRLQLTHDKFLNKKKNVAIEEDKYNADFEGEEELRKPRTPVKNNIGYERTDHKLIKEKIDSRKHDALVKRERALAYAYAYQVM